MRNIWHSLVWKEWHEHKWKFASIVAILWSTAVLCIFYGEHNAFALAIVALPFCAIPMAVFVGLGAATNERSRGTLAFLQALPAPMWRVALTKFLAGVLVLVVATVLTLPLFYAWNVYLGQTGVVFGEGSPFAAESPTGSPYFDLTLVCATLAASFFIWSAAAGVNRKDEVSAGAVTLTVMVGWYVLLAIVGYVLFEWIGIARQDAIEPNQWLEYILFGLSTGPGGFLSAFMTLRTNSEHLSDFLRHRDLLLIIAAASITHIALVGWYVRRFGRVFNIRIQSPQVARRQSSRQDWLSPPRQSALTAITWKQFRECGPLVVAGLAGVVGISLGIFAGNPSWFLSHPDELAVMMAVVGVTLGFAVTLIVGIGVCLYDVGPQLNTFWRSRPINPDMWFWSKFVTGLIILVFALDLPLIIVIGVIHPNPHLLFTQFSVTLIFAAQASLFAAAVAVTCLVRHAVYGAILSIPMMYFGIVVVRIALNLAYTIGWSHNAPTGIEDMSHAQLASGFLLTFLVSTVLGWLAMRYDWGRKSRY